MYVDDPLYRYVTRAGERAWQFAAFATWVLGFVTFQALYLIYTTAPFSVLPAGLPGPNNFTSVVVGDCVALPVINALIVVFYDACRNADLGIVGKTPAARITLANTKQNVGALLIAAIAGVVTYAWWFAVKKVDWTIPHPGELNAAGFYHASFLVIEVYILTNFTLSVYRLFAHMIRVQVATAPASDRVPMPPFVLVRIVGGVCLGGDVFALALLADVYSGRIPLASYYATALLSTVSTTIVIAVTAIGIHRCFRSSIVRDLTSLILFLVALVAALLPLAYVYLSQRA